MKDTVVTTPSSDSQSSSTCLETDDLVKSENVNSGKIGWQQRRGKLSQAKVKEKFEDAAANVLKSPTNLQLNTVEVHRKRGRPPKRKKLKAGKGPRPAGPDVDLHEERADTVPCTINMTSLPADITGHNKEDIFQHDKVEGPINHNPSQNEMSEPQFVTNGEQGGSTPVPLKRRRGRPKKDKLKASKDKLVNLADSDLVKEKGPARILRSRKEQQLSTADGKMTTPTRLNAKILNNSNRRGIKRGHKFRFILPKVAKLVSGDGVEADETGPVNTMKEEVDINDKDGLVTQLGGQGQGTTVKLETLGHTKFHLKEAVITSQSQPSVSPPAVPSGGLEPEPEPVTETEQILNPIPCAATPLPSSGAIPQDRAPLNPSMTSSKKERKPSWAGDILSNIKDEAVEVELDHFNLSESKPHMSLPCPANTMVKSECPSWNDGDAENQNSSIDRRQKHLQKCNEGGDIGNFPKPRRRKSLFGYRRNKQKRRPFLPAEPARDSGQDHETKDKPSVKIDSVNLVINEVLHKRTPRGQEKAMLKCKDCGRLFKFLSQYVIHRRIHTGERPYKCNECGKGFSKNSNLNLHLKTHKNYSMGKTCPYCQIRVPYAEYRAHMETHPPMDNQDCNEKRSDRQRQVDDHKKNEGSNTPDGSLLTDGKPTCQYCGKKFPFRSALVRHVRVHTGEKPYKCDICGRGFGQAYFLRVHELTHWSVKRYNCTLCGKSFTHYSNAKNHPCRYLKDIQEAHPRRRMKPSLSYTCHICKNTFNQLQDFNSHMRAHTGAKLYRCLFCDKLFGVLSEYNLHRNQCSRARGEEDAPVNEERKGTFEFSLPPNVRRNSAAKVSSFTNLAMSSKTQEVVGQKSLEPPQTRCRKPSKKLFQSTVTPPQPIVAKLNKLDNRSDPRKYLCPSCGRLFRHIGRLRAHMLTHGRGQSYTCGSCGKTLENWKKLWYHQRIHRQSSGRFTCPQCGRGFRFVGSYKRHMTEHPEVQWVQGRPNRIMFPYQCEECSVGFRTLDLLFSHQLCHSSLQDTNKDSDFLVSLDDYSTNSVGNMFHTPVKSCTTVLPVESHHTIYLSPGQMACSTEGLVFKPVLSLLPPKPAVPTTQGQSLETVKTIGQPTSVKEGKSITTQDKVEENACGMPAKMLNSEKKSVANNAIRLKECEGFPEDLKCAVCGSVLPTIAGLYEHYLQHARGQF